MINKVLFIIVVLSLVSCSEKKNYIGIEPQQNIRTLNVKEAIKPENYDRKVRISGKVFKVCKEEGCWLVLQYGNDKIRMIFKDPAISAPMDCEGKKLKAEGKIVEILADRVEAISYLKQLGIDTVDLPSGKLRLPVFIVETLYTDGIINEK
jgi:Domain of unknown function (DUF4920)